MSPLVSHSIERGIARITLHRPEVRNALSLELMHALREAVREVGGAVERDIESTRVMILGGEGKCFCAGMDLKAVAADPAAMGEMLRELSRVNVAIRRLPIPTIAQVQGAAIGGGCGLMVVCDFAFTHVEAKLGYPEVDLGICPAVVAPWLVRRIGAGRARTMLLAGGTMSGSEGFAAGLATHLVHEAKLADAVMAFAERLAKGGARAIAATKRWLNELDGSADESIAERGASISAEVIMGDEAQSRLRAVLAR